MRAVPWRKSRVSSLGLRGRQEPAPQVSVGRLFAVQLHVEPALLEVGHLRGLQIDRSTDRPARTGRRLEIEDDGTAHAANRALVHLYNRRGRLEAVVVAGD